MVEFAIILPILALLLVMAIDFGRVFFGWVGLHNGARVAADFAARNAESWPDERDLYRQLVINDMVAINCSPPTALDANGNGQWDPEDVPDPSFVDIDGNGVATDDGDHVVVRLDCRFDLMTPLAGSIVGDPAGLSAETAFPVNTILVPAVPTPEPTPPGPCPAPTALFEFVEISPVDSDPTDGRGTSPLEVEFTDTSIDDAGCPITSWEWTVDGAVIPGAGADPFIETFTHPTGTGGPVNFFVELTVETDDGLSDTFSEVIRVSRP